MAFKTALEIGLINSEEVNACSDAAIRAIEEIIAKTKGNKLLIAETVLKVIYLSEIGACKIWGKEFAHIYRIAILNSLFRMWDIDPMQFAIDCGKESK